MTDIPSGVLIAHAIAIPAAFLVGAIPFGFLVGKMKGIDIRLHGSGNTGATNLARVLNSKGWGLVVTIGDVFKGTIPVLIAALIAAPPGLDEVGQHAFSFVRAIGLDGIIGAAGSTSIPQWISLQIAVGAATILGHVFPPYLKFKGGKGVCTTAGALLGLTAWPAIIGIVMWMVVMYITRYVSIGSMAGAVSLATSHMLMNPNAFGSEFATTVLALAGVVLIVLRHRPNIARLMAGTERKIGAPKEAVDSTAEAEPDSKAEAEA